MNAQTLVRVTQQHIDLGQKRHCMKCPIALAVLEAVDLPSTTVQVDMDSIYRWQYAKTWLAKTPSVAQDFIEDFDSLNDVGPIEFTLTWHVVETEPQS